MTDRCAVVLAAGEGTRLRPVTANLPKALCPVGNVRLLDRVLVRLAALGLEGSGAVAVNACYLADQIVAAVGPRAHRSVEPPPPLGTSGGVANLRDWIDGRPVLVCNADAYLSPDPPDLFTGWDGETVRLLVVAAEPGAGEFGDARQWRFAGMSLLPWSVVRDLPAGTAELVTTAWRPAESRRRLELIPHRGVYFDCGTPASYLAANLHASGGHSVVGPGAVVRGRLTRSLVLPHGYVGEREHLVESIRIGCDVTIPAALV